MHAEPVIDYSVTGFFKPEVPDVNISAIRNDSRLGKTLRLPLKLLPPNTRMPILQGRLRGQKWIVGSSIHGCWLGTYEYEKRKIFESTIQEGSIVYDIGAHVGFYTLLSSILVGPSGRVVAFEPVKRNALFLKEHLRINGIQNVEVLEVAVSDHGGISNFIQKSSHSMGHLAGSPDNSGLPSKGESVIEVLSVSIDDLVHEAELPLPSYLKIDVEGGEAGVLRGSNATIVEAHPTIFLATHGRDVGQECLRLLEAAGYVLKPIGQTNRDGCDEFIAWYPDAE